MELFHTSPNRITEITDMGRFGEYLFFSYKPYVMTEAAEVIVYKMELDDEEVIRASQLFYHEDAEKLQSLVAELAERFDIDEEEAEALIEESKSVYDLDCIEAEDLGDASWDVQRFTARAAEILGFRAVAVQDEQGTAYMVNMMGHEGDLIEVHA